MERPFQQGNGHMCEPFVRFADPPDHHHHRANGYAAPHHNNPHQQQQQQPHCALHNPDRSVRFDPQLLQQQPSEQQILQQQQQQLQQIHQQHYQQHLQQLQHPTANSDAFWSQQQQLQLQQRGVPQAGALRPSIIPATDVLMRRMRRLPGFKDIPETLLFGLLAGSNGSADKLQEGVTLFEQGERTGFWYLLLSGQVEVYLPSRTHGLDATIPLNVLSAGSLFGELEVPVHTCSARTRKPSEFVRIAQSAFVNLYNKNADILHSIVLVMQDMVSEEKVPTPPLDGQYGMMSSRQGFAGDIRPHALNDPFSDNGYERGVDVDQFGNDMEFTACDRVASLPQHETQSIVEFTNSMGLYSRLQDVGRILQREMATTDPKMIADRTIQGRHYMSSMIGAEMVDWLLNATLKTSTTGAALSRFQVAGMWQALLESDVIAHVSNEQYFADKQIFYKWTHQTRSMRDPVEDTTDELTSAIFLLSTIGPDSLFRMILAKCPSERTPEELELVYEELLHVKALAHLSTMVKRELAAVIGIETHNNAGTVIFHQGDPGACWYIILRGAVDVSIRGKGVVCTLREGDDFGKLALVNESKRAATIILRDDEAQFLRVEKNHFNRPASSPITTILLEIERKLM